jgi:hypothetical protein
MINIDYRHSGFGLAAWYFLPEFAQQKHHKV